MARTLHNLEEDNNYCYVDKLLRTVYINGEITQALASKFRRHVKSLDATKKPIIVEINSPGGDIEAGLMIIDTIRLCKNKTVTRVTGQAFSMACIIACSGDRREMLPNSVLMSHQGSFVLACSYDNINNELQFVRGLEEKCWAIMDTSSGKKPGYWKEKSGNKDLYLNAQSALSEGLIDKICKKGKYETKNS